MRYRHKAASLLAVYCAGYAAISVIDADFVPVCVLSIAIMSALSVIASQLNSASGMCFVIAQVVAMSLTVLMMCAYVLVDQSMYSMAASVYTAINDSLLLLDVTLLVMIACGFGRFNRRA